MTYEQIRALITARMVAFTGVEQARIDYPNQPAVFTPPATGLWCRLNIQYASAFMAGMADRPHPQARADQHSMLCPRAHRYQGHQRTCRRT